MRLQALIPGCKQSGEKMILQRAVRRDHGSNFLATRMKDMSVTEVIEAIAVLYAGGVAIKSALAY